MALPDSGKYVRGTTLVFSDSGTYSPTSGQPTGTDADINMNGTGTGIATGGVCWQSAQMDIGTANIDVLWVMDAYIEFFSAPTPGGTVGLYLGFSDVSGSSRNPGGLSASDAVYQGYGADTASGTEALGLLEFIGSLTVTNDAVLQVKMAVGYFTPPSRYCYLVVENNTSVAIAATDAIECAVAITPLTIQTQD